MFKNMIKRSMYNIVRKKNKTIVLSIIMFVLANLVLASLAISSAVEESTNFAKATLNSEIYLSVDMESVMGSIDRDSIDMESGDKSAMFAQRPVIYSSVVNDLSNISYVQDYTYNVTLTTESSDINYYESSTTEQSNSMGRPNMNNMRSGLSVYAYNSYAFIPEVSENTISIEEGTYFDESTPDSVVISYELAEYNDLVLGDSITLTNSSTEEEFTYEIIGIFASTNEGYENIIYMNIDTSEDLMGSDQYNGGDYSVSNVIYYLDNPDNVDLFIEEANSLYDFEELSLTLDIDNSAYEAMAGPIESVGSFAGTILVIVVIAAVFIITLIINNNIKDRKYEMGVLLSLGATKLNIVGQILVELVVVTTIGFTLSIATSSFLASSMGDSMLENQLQMSTEQSESNFNRPTSGGMSGGPQSGAQGQMQENVQTQSSSDVDAIDTIELSIGIGEYALLFTTGYLISFIAMLLPAMSIMKYEPKTILTGRE